PAVVTRPVTVHGATLQVAEFGGAEKEWTMGVPTRVQFVQVPATAVQSVVISAPPVKAGVNVGVPAFAKTFTAVICQSMPVLLPHASLTSSSLAIGGDPAAVDPKGIVQLRVTEGVSSEASAPLSRDTAP